ncbi:MAG: RNA polymerase sigma factor [Rhizobiaceae bacterium]
MTSPPIHTKQAIEHIVREDWGRILAVLVKHLRDFQLAEDSLQDAVEAALQHWPERGIPKIPIAWLLQTARRKAIDRIRRHKNFERKQPEYALLMEHEETADTDMIDEAIPDERLRMIFTCCHPALDEKSRVALTLRTLGGLTTDEIAASFLDKEKTMAQRLVRAKRKIKDAAIAYEIPEPEFWDDRLSSVLSVLYLIFNEGYSASTGEDLIRFDLCEEAIRLTRAIGGLLPDEPEIMGLLALMLLHHSRSKTRYENEFIPLKKQNRKAWSQELIIEGTTLVKQALTSNALGPYQLQAAISAVHSEAESHGETDWRQIVLLYEELFRLQSSPIIRLNQAMAISYANSVSEALQWITMHNLAEALQTYQPYHATMADLHNRNDNRAAAITAYKSAIELSENQPEKTFLKSRLNKLLH